MIFDSLRSNARERFQKFLGRRLPPAKSFYLNQKRVFVLPTSQGVGFIVLCCLIWLLGINFENNLALAMCYLMLSLFVVCIHHSFNNLSGLTITALNAGQCFKGEDVEMELLVSRRGKRPYENVHLTWPEGNGVSVDLQEQAEARIKLYVPATQRGWFKPGRLLVETVYPLGLIRCWTWLDLDFQALVFPAPVSRGLMPEVASSEKEGTVLRASGSEDFVGFSEYRAGHSLRHVAWKQYARGQGLLLKDYGDFHSPQLWLDWESLPGLGKEARLSALCFWALELDRKNGGGVQQFGLRLPGVEIAPASGAHHKQQVLKALALC